MDQLTLDEYQSAAKKTAIYPGHDERGLKAYPALGLAGEVGEVCEHIKKAIRDDGSQVSHERWLKLHAELGDLLWYLSETASMLEMSLVGIARANLNKLQDRQGRGRLNGCGDNR